MSNVLRDSHALKAAALTHAHKVVLALVDIIVQSLITNLFALKYANVKHRRTALGILILNAMDVFVFVMKRYQRIAHIAAQEYLVIRFLERAWKNHLGQLKHQNLVILIATV